MENREAFGVYFIFKSMEQGRTFRISVPKYPTQDPNYRILVHQTSRFTHYYFYIRDQVLGPVIVRMASFFPFHATCWINGHSFMEQQLNRKQIAFRKDDNAFLAVDDVIELQAAADRLSPEVIRKQLDYWTLIVEPKFSKKERAQVNLSRFYAISQNELVSNNLHDFGLKKGLDHLDAVRKRFQVITDRFADFQAQSLNVHVDFPLLQRVALPITIGSVRFPGIKIHDQRIIRLLEVLLHNGSTVGGWTAKQIHQAVLTAFQLSANSYGLNQLRYDLRKLKGHALLERDGSRYAYRLTAKGVDVALLFLFFHERLCGPLANRRFHHKPNPACRPNSKLETAYHKADKAIENIVNLLKAA
jgi:hypothetical protein